MRLTWVHQKRMEDVIAMKKLTVAMMAVVALAMVPSASWALPPVQLAPDCAAANEIDMWAANAISGLDLGDYATSDFDADGVPDKFQFGLLGAVLCAGDPTVAGQWADNSEAIATYLATMDPFNTAEPATGAALAAIAPTIAAFYAAHTAQIGALGGAAAFGLLLLGNPGAGLPNLADLAGLLDGGQEITFVLPVFIPWTAAQMGISTESNAALRAVWSEYFGLFPLIGQAMVGYYKPALAGVATIAGIIADPAFPTLAADATAAKNLTNTCGAALATISGNLPAVAIYGGAKTATEPFSGEGDYNGNGDTNKSVYDGVVADGGDRTDFVARASGAEVFYTGNPGVPVAGILGLALLAGACVMGGAASIRRK